MTSAKAEMEALWTATFGEPPPIDASAEMLAAVMARCAPLAISALLDRARDVDRDPEGLPPD